MAFRNTSLHTGQTYLSGSIFTKWGNSAVKGQAPIETREFSIINQFLNGMNTFYNAFPFIAQKVGEKSLIMQFLSSRRLVIHRRFEFPKIGIV